MATWFAQNSSVNIDSVNQWNSAANGSGSWLTWASLGASDILVANGKTAIVCNVSFTCATITTAATGGTAGGGFTCPSAITLTANVVAGTTTCISCATAGITVGITGNVTGGASVSAHCISISAGMSLNITGNVTGGSASTCSGVISLSTSTVSVTGNATAGAATNCAALYNNSSGIVNLYGDCTAGAAVDSPGIYAKVTTASITCTGTVTASPQSNGIYSLASSLLCYFTGNFVNASNGTNAVYSIATLIHATTATAHTYRVNNAGVAGVARSLYTGGVNLGQPVVANVRSGTVYGAASEYTGTLAVPSPTLVAIGVSTDNTVGSYAPTGGLDAAGVRTAIGLASANLDTQLSGIQSDTNDIQTRLPAALESGRIAAALDSPTQTQIDNIEATLTTLGSESTTVERSVSDTNAITFSWPVSGATITGTASLNNGTYGAVAGAIAFLRTETGRHYYTLAYNAADRPSAEGQVRYKFVDGTYTGYVVLRTVNLVTVAQVNAQVLDVLSVDTFGELGSPPAATSSLKDKLVWLFMWARNKATATSSQRKLFADDTTTVVSTETITDDGTTFTKGESL